MTIPATILITRPMKIGDPTEYTYQWAEEAIKLMNSYGYEVIDIKKENVDYNTVSKAIKYYHPRLYMHVGHGCPSSLQGQTECIVTRKFDVNELVSMSNFREIIAPLIYSSGCENTCMNSLEKDICSPFCLHDTNVNLLKGTIVYTIACYSASQLGKCAVKSGADAYIGYSDLMLFPVDKINSQDIFKDVHVKFLEMMLEGYSVNESLNKINKYEDALIKFYKSTKYISLPLLWNKKNRRVLGNGDSRIYT